MLRKRSGRTIARFSEITPPNELATTVGWRHAEMLEERRQVVSVLPHASLSVGAGALRVTATVIGNDPERFREAGHDSVETVVIAPRAVNQDHRGPRISGDLVEERDAVHGRMWHRLPPRGDPDGPSA
ncbi:MAG TPA: hypothetical protein VGR49_04135 [Actinomycetota bacterium]|jgi:hypothetical protein|nr:hypothetical protein [Actinomycetota bacterium]